MDALDRRSEPDGGFARTFGREGNGPAELERPMHISIGPDGLLYVAEYLNDRISVFKLDGTFVRHLTGQGLDAPAGVAVDKSGVVYVANFYGHDVLVLSLDGKLARWGRAGRVWHGELHYPTDVAVAPDGSLWVADAYNNRLQRFVDGHSTNVVGWDPGLRVFGFRVAAGLGVDALGRIYGADFAHGKVRVFDAQGTPLESFGRRSPWDPPLRHRLRKSSPPGVAHGGAPMTPPRGPRPLLNAGRARAPPAASCPSR